MELARLPVIAARPEKPRDCSRRRGIHQACTAGRAGLACCKVGLDRPLTSPLAKRGHLFPLLRSGDTGGSRWPGSMARVSQPQVTAIGHQIPCLVLQRHVGQLSMAQVVVFQELKSFLRISIRTWLMDQNPCETSHFLAIGVLTQRCSTRSLSEYLLVLSHGRWISLGFGLFGLGPTLCAHYPPQSTPTLQERRQIFKRLWVKHISCHSADTFSRPRNRNLRIPRADLIMPNTGSTMCLRTA